MRELCPSTNFPSAKRSDKMKRTLVLKSVLTPVLVAVLIASTCWAQDPVVNSPPLPSYQAVAPAAAPEQTIVIPAGTRIPLSLTSPIAAKSARPGFAVRAITVFPVTIDTQLVIPVGSYVEGAIDKVTKGGPSGHTLQMRFTRIVYTNGYSVTVDATNTQARASSPDLSSPESAAFSSADRAADPTASPVAAEPNYALAAQQSPTPPPPPKVGPNIGTVAGVSLGLTAAGIVALVLLIHHQGGGNAVLFDTGWQFEMVLKSPVSVNAMSIAAAIAPSGAQ
jgi:hypothetical protein